MFRSTPALPTAHPHRGPGSIVAPQDPQGPFHASETTKEEVRMGLTNVSSAEVPSE